MILPTSRLVIGDVVLDVIGNRNIEITDLRPSMIQYYGEDVLVWDVDARDTNVNSEIKVPRKVRMVCAPRRRWSVVVRRGNIPSASV